MAKPTEQSPARLIDHIVYAVPNLNSAIQLLKAQTGVTPVIGGRHTNQGTKNALLNLGDHCYLEILAADPENKAIQSNRWMGVDWIEAPTITRWSLKSNQLEKDSALLKAYQSDMGVIHKGQRKMTSGQLLAWEMILPLAQPKVEIVPFMTDWQQSDSHPTDNLPATCQLTEFTIHHPNPGSIQQLFHQLEIDLIIQEGPKPKISIKLNTPNGNIFL